MEDQLIESCPCLRDCCFAAYKPHITRVACICLRSLDIFLYNSAVHWLGRHRLMILAGICAFITVLVLALHFAAGVPFLSIVWSSEQAYEDVLRREGRKTKTHNDFVFIGIDQESLKLTAVGPEEIQNNRAFQLMTERPFPWSREIWALLLDRLFSAGARVVMFDMIFGAHYDGDAAFGAALERYRDK